MRLRKLVFNAGRMLIILWIIRLALLVGFTMTSKSDEIELPGIAGLYLASVLCITVLTIITAFVLDMAERIKKDGFHAVTGLFMVFLAALPAAVLFDYL